MGNSEIIPFGKYKGKPVESLAADSPYCEWLLQQPWFRDRYPVINTVIVNNFKENHDSPAHNSMQVKFLDPSYAYSVIVLSGCIARFDEWHEKSGAVGFETLPSFHRNQTQSYSVEFEASGWDVICKTIFIRGYSFCREKEDRTASGDCYKHFEWGGCFCFELKPSIGEDYAAVMRQVKSYRSPGTSGKVFKIVLAKEFTAESVTLSDVRKMFLASGIRLIVEGEIHSIDAPEWFLKGDDE